jgi:hypothetical protein
VAALVERFKRCIFAQTAESVYSRGYPVEILAGKYATLLRKLDRAAEAKPMEVHAKAIRAAH